jgi:threonine synthase
VLVPTGDGVILSGVAKGFADLKRCGLIRSVPRLIAVQPEGSAAIVHALRKGADTITPVANAASVAGSLVVQAPRNALQCLRVIRASGGGGVAVSDEAIIRAIAELARLTGVFAEPAGAAVLAGLHAALEQGLVNREERVVLLVTGSGLKDVPAASRAVQRPAPIPPALAAIAERIRRDAAR